jgi:hypothetical protein
LQQPTLCRQEDDEHIQGHGEGSSLSLWILSKQLVYRQRETIGTGVINRSRNGYPMAIYPTNADPRLLDFKAQERYYTKVVDRLMSFCSKAGDGDELLRQFAQLNVGAAEQGKKECPPKATKTAMSNGLSTLNLDKIQNPAENKDLSTLIMAMRKLREGIVASNRVDDFATQVYVFCIRLSILLKHMESYHPAILYLLRNIHTVKPLSSIELQEFVGYLVLDLACRQQDYAQAYAVRHQYGLRDSKVDATLAALAHDNFHKFWIVKKNVDGHKAKLMEFAEEGMRTQALKCLGRTYFSIDLEYLERATNTRWQSLTADHNVGWELDGSKVVIRKPKGR